MKITVFGIGNFGFAIIKHLNQNRASIGNARIVAYDINPRLINHLIKTRRHLYHHKSVTINTHVTFTNDPRDIFQDSDIIILAILSNAVIDNVQKYLSYCSKPSIILNTAKALDYTSGKSFSQIIENNKYYKKNKCSYAVISGGTIASDLFHHEPLGVDIASKSKYARNLLKKVFTSDNLNVYLTQDVLGVEYAGAFKNIISILAGLINGLGFSYGSETHFITRASNEIVRFLKKKIKFSPTTFSIHSQCWGNDLWLSCTGNTRNREFGTLIGSGMKPSAALAEMTRKHKTVEGIQTIHALEKMGISNQYPILSALNRIVLHNASPRKTIRKLMTSNKI